MAEVVIPKLTIEGKEITFTATNNYLVGMEFGSSGGAFVGYEFGPDKQKNFKPSINDCIHGFKITAGNSSDSLDKKINLTKGTILYVWTDLSKDPLGDDDQIGDPPPTPRGTLVIVQ